MHSTWLATLFLTSLYAHCARAQGVFDPEAEMCCGGDVHSLSGSDDCCHGRPFNASTHLCCSPDNRVSTVPIPLDERHKQGRLAVTYECCGAEAVDAAEQLCCLGVASKRTYAHSACCGAKVYDADRFVCCGESSLFRRQSHQSSSKGNISLCCGGLGYDPKRHLCCEGKLHSQWSVTTAACCGTQAYDIGFQICCDGQVINDPFGIQGCCGDAVYDVFLGLCCGKNVFSDPMRTKSCCGDVAYDPSNQTCCGSTVTAKIPLKSNQSCCLPPSFEPSSSSENAGDDVSHEDASEEAGLDAIGQSQARKESRPLDDAHAQGVVYELDEHVCCDGQVVKGRRESSECCGGRAFDKDGEWECCDGRTLTRKWNVRSEAADEARCCRGKVVQVPKNKQLCC